MAVNQSSGANFMRSAKAPTIRAGVMTAKVIWNIANTDSGTVSVKRVAGHAGQEGLVEAAEERVRLICPASMPCVLNARL